MRTVSRHDHEAITAWFAQQPSRRGHSGRAVDRSSSSSHDDKVSSLPRVLSNDAFTRLKESVPLLDHALAINHLAQALMSRSFPGDGQLVLRLKVVVREDVKVRLQRLLGNIVAREMQANRGHFARAEMVVSA